MVRSILIFLTLVTLAIPGGLEAQKSPPSTPEDDPLASLARIDERLRPTTEVETLEQAQGQLPGSLAGGWDSFLQHAGGTWSAYIDLRNGGLELAEGSGLPWIPGFGNDLTLTNDAKVDLAAIERIARDFLPKIAALLPLGPEDSLVLNPGRSGQVADYLWYTDFDVYRGALAIEGARVNFRINNGNLIQFGSENLPAAGWPTPEPAISKEQALAALSQYIGGLTGQETFLNPGSLHLLTVEVRDQGSPRGFKPGQGRGLLPVWELLFRRAGETATWLARVDGMTGAVIELYDVNQTAQALGGVRKEGDLHDTVLPVPFTDLDSGGFTDAAGGYPAGGPVTSTLNGQYFQIRDECGEISLTSDPIGNLFFGAATNRGGFCATPGVGDRGNTRSARTQYYFLNRAAEMARRWLPGNTLPEPISVNTNVSALECNARWNGSLSFARSSTGCFTSGEIPSISVHEFGHALDQYDGNGFRPPAVSDYGTGETYGDFTAALFTHRSCIGSGFFAGTGNCRAGNIAGAVDACTACTGLRDIDWERLVSRTAHTVANFTQTRCSVPTERAAGYLGPCGREGHCESQISSEALWDFVTRDLPGGAAAWSTMERLWFLSRPTARSGFNCITSGTTWTSHGCFMGSLFQVLRAADDDDGNLDNGTPHSAELFAAFDRHGIACATPGARTSFRRCAPPAAPDLLVVPTPGISHVGWTSAGPDVVYDVYRSELGCDAGFVRIASGLTDLVHPDRPVAPGVSYSYQVVAHRAGNAACASAPSPCRTVTYPTGANLWSRDTSRDTGIEPYSPAPGEEMYNSPDIWVSHELGGPPAPPRVGDNFVYVKVRNLSATVPAYNVSVKFYAARASTGLAWPRDWTEIGTAPIPELAAAGEIDVAVPWSPTEEGHFCLLVRILAPYDPLHGEGEDVNVNTRRNNGIVWRNVHVVPRMMGLGFGEAELIVRNPYELASLARLTLRDVALQWGPFLSRGQVTVTFPQELVAAWEKAGQQGKGFKRVDDRTFQPFDAEAYWIVPLAGREEHEVLFRFKDTAPENPSQDPSPALYLYEVVQRDEEKGMTVGGVTYQVEAPQTP